MSTHTQLKTSREIELADLFSDDPKLEPDRDRSVTGEKFRKMMSFDWNLDLKPALRKLDWGTTHLTPAQRILTDIHRYQRRFADGKNEWVEIGVVFGFSFTVSPSKLAEIKDLLEAKGCIKISRFKLYGPCGSEAYKYKFTPEFYSKAVKPAEQGKAVQLRKANKNRKPREIKSHSERIGLLQQVKRNSEMLRVDMEAIEDLMGNMSAGQTVYASSMLEPFYGELVSHHISEDRNGRIYSPFIQMDRGWRPHVYHEDGKELVDIDIKTCHALLLFANYKKRNDPDSIYGEEKEKRLFKQIIVNRDLYKYLGNKVNKYLKKGTYSRDKIKRYFNSFLNSDAWCDGEDVQSKDFKEYRAGKGYINKVGKAFDNSFPILFKRMKEQVASNLKYIISKNEKPSFGNGLMAMESKVLDPVYSELMAKELFFIPCHDGVLVEADAVETTITLILRSLKQHTGLGDRKLIKINKYK